MDNQRLVGIVGVVVVAIAAIVIAVSSGGDDEPKKADTTAPVATQTTTEEAPPRPEVPEVSVEGGKPVGGVQRLEFTKGDIIRFDVVSDAGGEVHFHGYDISRDLTPGKPVRFRVKAKLEGIFEVEIEDTKTPIAEVRVEP